jgi:hypothetical protein
LNWSIENMTTLRKCFLFAAVGSAALLFSARDASACWGRYRACCYEPCYSSCYAYQGCYAYQPSSTCGYQPYSYACTYQPYATYAYQPYYTYPTWSIGQRWGWRLFR